MSYFPGRSKKDHAESRQQGHRNIEPNHGLLLLSALSRTGYRKQPDINPYREALVAQDRIFGSASLAAQLGRVEFGQALQPRISICAIVVPGRLPR